MSVFIRGVFSKLYSKVSFIRPISFGEHHESNDNK